MKHRIKQQLKKHHSYYAIAGSVVCCMLAYLGAFCLRFDCGAIPESHIATMWLGLPIIVLIRLSVLMAFRVHRGLYRYVSMHDFVQLFKAVTLGSLVFAMVWTLTLMDRYFMPRSIYLIDWMLSMGLLVGMRVAVRIWRSHRIHKLKMAPDAGVGRALVVGAGNMGESMLRMLDRRFLGNEYDVVGFVDDDAMKEGSAIHGVAVLGKLADIPELIVSYEVDTIVFAISDPPAHLFNQVFMSCEGLEVRFNTVSVLKDVHSGEVSYDQMRRLRVEDLLGRKPVEVNPEPVERAVKGIKVLVTGAGGSIGSELCRQLASFGPAELVLVDNSESPLFEIDRELRQRDSAVKILPRIGDIKHVDVMEEIFAETRPDFVYHAAAYKHVPLMEDHPDEAVLNNVRGTRILAETARKFKCKRFVMVSTDKAVRPTNVMGATKRMCELVIQSLNGGDTVFTAVRFGNVLGSNGSVIPIFRKQIEAGGPLTVTHPDMTRYFMTIPEAVTLVLQCGVIAEAGDVFVLDMGTPVKIMDLARNMIRLSGLRENVDVSIEVTGLRPGEKMYEELVAYGEALTKTSVPKVNVLKQQSGLLACDVLLAMMRRLEQVAWQRKVERTREILWRLIELDIERAREGMDELAGKSTERLIAEWSDTVSLMPSKLDEVKHGRILALVGNLDIEQTLTEIVHAAGYAVDCVDSRDEVLGHLASATAYVAVLCDFILPNETAWEFKEHIRARGLQIPVVSMSIYDSEALSEILKVDHGMTVLQKPFDAPVLEEALEAVLQKPFDHKTIRQAEETAV